MHSKKAFGQHHEKCFGSMNTSLLKSLNADMQITNTKRQYRPKVSRPPIPSGNIIFVVLYWGGGETKCRMHWNHPVTPD